MLSYVTGWLYMLAIWMLDLGTHYGTAILIVGAINIYYPDCKSGNISTSLNNVN